MTFIPLAAAASNAMLLNPVPASHINFIVGGNLPIRAAVMGISLLMMMVASSPNAAMISSSEGWSSSILVVVCVHGEGGKLVGAGGEGSFENISVCFGVLVYVGVYTCCHIYLVTAGPATFDTESKLSFPSKSSRLALVTTTFPAGIVVNKTIDIERKILRVNTLLLNS